LQNALLPSDTGNSNTFKSFLVKQLLPLSLRQNTSEAAGTFVKKQTPDASLTQNINT
jgi:hypothetical protein